LENFAGCAVVISHDRMFLDRLATHILAFEGDSHDFEFLREQYAHLRLGFSDAQIEHWLKCAGLSLEKTVSFAPEENGNAKGLTVKLWFARDPRFLIADNNIIREIA